ncbi:Serine carboxypeptidase-like 20 [Camellia lanceoleosa]|uniref:Serine carboxypeptidase-like 20 n=1 Tax=Camellia lanceoleosa TaxID=1840588 RepID=A0ACC0HT40_9ERIC|nr:Serine carboxypeptidase-like 20 [Camellia lanceoleosa]
MCLGFGLTEAVPANSFITKLPGFNATFPSKHYSGYVSIDGNPAKQLFYYFVKSERKPSNDPVVLWLNGGPGCSSFDGFVYEHANALVTKMYEERLKLPQRDPLDDAAMKLYVLFGVVES